MFSYNVHTEGRQHMRIPRNYYSSALLHLLTVTKRIEQKQQGETVKPQRTGIERIEKDK